MGVNFFKGQFFSCQGLSPTELEAVDNSADCLAAGGTWENARSNFDNTYDSMVTLFEMITTEGWMTVMNNGIDARGIDKQPKKDSQVMMALYFV